MLPGRGPYLLNSPHVRLELLVAITYGLAMNKVVTLEEAAAHISTLISEAEAGSEITITRGGKPVARLSGTPRGVTRTPGDWQWTGPYDPAVFAPMTDEEMREEGWPV